MASFPDQELKLVGLQNVSAMSSSYIAKARIGTNACLTTLILICDSRQGDYGLVKGGISEEHERR